MVVMAAEDLLLHKLLANRPRDRSDVADLLLVGGALEMEYVRTWAEHLGVSARLADDVVNALAAQGRQHQGDEQPVIAHRGRNARVGAPHAAQGFFERLLIQNLRSLGHGLHSHPHDGYLYVVYAIRGVPDK